MEGYKIFWTNIFRKHIDFLCQRNVYINFGILGIVTISNKVLFYHTSSTTCKIGLWY